MVLERTAGRTRRDSVRACGGQVFLHRLVTVQHTTDSGDIGLAGRPLRGLRCAELRHDVFVDGMAAALPPTEGIEAVPAVVGGIKGEWVRGKHVKRNDAAVLYLHGGGYVIGSPKSHRHLCGLLSIESGLPVSRFPTPRRTPRAAPSPRPALH